MDKRVHAGHLGELTYGELIRRAVNRKWPDPESKEKWYTRFTLSRRKKLIKLFDKQNGLCIFCGCETWVGGADRQRRNPPPGMNLKQMATADHKIPQAMGGTDRIANLAMACSECNNSRQTTPFEEFMRDRQDPVRWKERNRKLSQKYEKASAERKVKSEQRAVQLIWKLGVLFYLRPDLVEAAKTLPLIDRYTNKKNRGE